MSTNPQYLNLFQVPIQKTNLELNIDSLIEFCYELKRKDKKGVVKTNVGGWHSGNIFNETHTEFVELKNKIEEEANIYHHEIQLKKAYHQKINNIWVNINQKGHLNDFHVHPQSIFSGAFYLRGNAPIVFQHPFRNISSYYWDEHIVEKWNVVTSGQWRLEPEPNMLLIFPPWVEHKVLMNEEDTDRISFSFNTSIQKIDRSKVVKWNKQP